MITQDLRHKKLGSLAGLLLIAGIVAAIFLGLALANLAAPYVGALPGTLAVWLLGGLLALYVAKRYVIEFRYSLDGKRLRVERLYGERARFMLEIPRANIVRIGAPEEIAAKYPGARPIRATLRDCALTTWAVAYRDGEKTRILWLQPNENLQKRLDIR